MHMWAPCARTGLGWPPGEVAVLLSGVHSFVHRYISHLILDMADRQTEHPWGSLDSANESRELIVAYKTHISSASAAKLWTTATPRNSRVHVVEGK